MKIFIIWAIMTVQAQRGTPSKLLGLSKWLIISLSKEDIFWSKRTEANEMFLFYARTPKTGGGTVRADINALNKSLKFFEAARRVRHTENKMRLVRHVSSVPIGSLELMLSLQNRYFRGNIYPLLKKQDKDHERKMLDSHMHFIDFTRYGYPNPIYLNTLRDPVQRFISRYGCWFVQAEQWLMCPLQVWLS